MSRPRFNDQKNQDCYSIAIFADEDTLDLIDETLGKDIKRKKCKTSEFEAKHHFPAPYPDEKSQYWININNNANDKDGKPYELWMDLRPNVMLVSVDAEGKKNAKDVTLENNVGNGSRGNIVLSRFTNTFGSFLSTRKVYITEHVVYETSGTYDPIADALGIDSVEVYSDEELTAKGQGKTQEERQGEDDLAKTPNKVEEKSPDLPEELPDAGIDFDSTIPF